VSALFFLIAAVFPLRVFHCTGFNEVDGEAGLMVDCLLHLVIREVRKVSAREEGVCWKYFSLLEARRWTGSNKGVGNGSPPVRVEQREYANKGSMRTKGIWD